MLPVSIGAGAIFFALNLYSGSHVLPQVLVPPSPPSLSEKYVLALVAGDREGALRLSGSSSECQAIMGEVFKEHQGAFTTGVGEGWEGIDFQEITVKSLQTFYEPTAQDGFRVLPPPPSQLAFVMAEMENGKTVWLELKMGTAPFLEGRQLCVDVLD